MQKICQIYAKDMPKICQRYANDMQKVHQRYAKDMPKIPLRYAKDNTDASKDEWKSLLDGHLALIPDNPAIDGLVPEPCDRLLSSACNSLLSWSRLLNLSDRRTVDDSLHISL